MEKDLQLALTYTVSDIKTNKQKAEHFAETFYQLFGIVPCVSCSGELHSAINQLHNYKTYKKSKMENQKYKLKKDVLLWSNKLHKHFTNVNMTDEAAQILIEEYPEYERLFDTSDPIVKALENFEAGDNEKAVSPASTKTLDKKQIELKVKAKKK